MPFADNNAGLVGTRISLQPALTSGVTVHVTMHSATLRGLRSGIAAGSPQSQRPTCSGSSTQARAV
jgi:hypothetical protein